jgi:hypothetical protein
MSIFAATIIRAVRSDLQGFDASPLSLSVHLARAENADAVVEAFPFLLLNEEDDDLVSCISHCVGLIPGYGTFNIWNKVRLMRAQRG